MDGRIDGWIRTRRLRSNGDDIWESGKGWRKLCTYKGLRRNVSRRRVLAV